MQFFSMRKGWLKHVDHVPHPTNDEQMSVTTRFRHVFDDGFGWGSASGIFGEEGSFLDAKRLA